MTKSARLIVLAVVCIVALGAATGYVLHAHGQQQDAIRHATPVPQTSLADVSSQPHIVFQNRALGAQYGMVSAVALDNPGGPRTITKTSCDRVYAAQDKIVCLAARRGVVTTYSARVLTANMKPVQPLPLTGIPSRARLSADAKYASTTTFVAGDSYAGASFSTRTTITKVGDRTVGDLESFSLLHDGRRIAPPDRNFWGVTFAPDDNSFYATVAWSGHTWLAKGDLAKKTITTIRQDAECPSLSPDGKHIVYKRRGSLPPGQWRLVGYDIASGRVTPLTETRSVDDQVAWLDDSHVMYGLPRAAQRAVDDVWTVPIAGPAKPRMLIAQAWSPALVR